MSCRLDSVRFGIKYIRILSDGLISSHCSIWEKFGGIEQSLILGGSNPLPLDFDKKGVRIPIID